jgi:hypothetical protein
MIALNAKRVSGESRASSAAVTEIVKHAQATSKMVLSAAKRRDAAASVAKDKAASDVEVAEAAEGAVANRVAGVAAVESSDCSTPIAMASCRRKKSTMLLPYSQRWTRTKMERSMLTS